MKTDARVINGGNPLLRAVVLAGGASRRFGSDKALANFGGRPLLTRLLDLAGRVDPEPALAVNAAGRYAELAPTTVLVDVIPGRGPLSGIHAALATLGADAVLVLTCDMPRVTPALIEKLATAWRPGDGVTAADRGLGPEPFPAVYDASLTHLIANRLKEGRLGVKALIDEVRTKRVIDARGFADDFFNMNTPADYAGLMNRRLQCQCQDRWNSSSFS